MYTFSTEKFGRLEGFSYFCTRYLRCAMRKSLGDRTYVDI